MCTFLVSNTLVAHACKSVRWIIFRDLDSNTATRTDRNLKGLGSIKAWATQGWMTHVQYPLRGEPYRGLKGIDCCVIV